MNFLEKIQNLPLATRKIILWFLIIIIGILILWFWMKIFSKSLNNLQNSNLMEELKLPELQEKIKKNMPKMENLPQINLPKK